MVALSALWLLPSAPPRTYDAHRATGRITIDGRLDEAEWSAAPWTEDFADILGDAGVSPPLRTRAKILWDDEQLYIGAEMEEPHLWATLMDRDAIIYRDDDFEIFLDPDGDGMDYFEIEVNPHGALLDLFLNEPYSGGGRARIDWDLPGLRAHVWLMGTLNDPSDLDRGWSVEMAIPWADLTPPVDGGNQEGRPTRSRPGFPPGPGDSWRINFSRVDWPLEIVNGAYRKTAEPSRGNPHPESNWVWSPQGAINMHLPERWGVVRFVTDPQNSMIEELQIETGWNRRAPGP